MLASVSDAACCSWQLTADDVAYFPLVGEFLAPLCPTLVGWHDRTNYARLWTVELELLRYLTGKVRI